MNDIEITITPGMERRTWCEKCALPHVITTIWGYVNGDPTSAQIFAVISDCEETA